MQVLRRFALVLVLGVFVAGLAACGGDDDESGGGGGATTPAQSSGGKKDAGERTIGVIPSTLASEHLQVRIKQTKDTFAPLGWKLDVCDGAGNPQAMEQCMQRFVSAKHDAIFTLALGGNEIPRGIAAAKAAKIPVVAYITDPLEDQQASYTGVFADGTINMGKIAGNYIAEQRKDIPVVGMRITQNFAGDGFIQGVEQVFEEKSLKFQDLRDTDLADLINSMTKTTQAIVQKNKGQLTFVEFSDFGYGIAKPVFDRGNRSKDITFITRYDNPSTVKAVKAGDQVLMVTTKGYQHIFDAVDWLLEAWANNKPLERKIDISEPEGGVYGKEDIPEGESIVFPFEPALEEQKTKWAETYNLKG